MNTRLRHAVRPWLPLLLLGSLSTAAAHATPASVRLTSNSAASTVPAIATGIDGLSRVVWQDARDGNNEIYYALVDGFGNRLTGDVNASKTASVSSTLPKVGVDGQGNAILCWREANNVWVAKLDKSGAWLVNPKLVNLGFSYVVMMGPDLSVQADGRCAIGLGAQHGGLDDMFIVNLDGGLNKTCQTTNLYTNVTFNDSKVSVSCSGNLNCTLAWQQIGYLDGNSLATVGSATNCSRSGVNYLCSGTGFSSPNEHGAGLLYSRSNHVYLASSTGCGTQLSENPGPSIAPAGDSLTTSKSIAVWEDRRSGNSDVYFAVYANSGLAKQGIDSALVTGASASQAPVVSTDRLGTAFFAWQDDRDGNSEIYFTRDPDLSAYRGAIAGTVYDALTLAPIANATVTLIGPQPGTASQDYVARADGTYRLAGLLPGRYTATASYLGHVSPIYPNLDVTAGGTLTQDILVSTGTTLDGTVRDEFNQLAIGGANLHLVSANGLYIRNATTNPEGRYHLDVPTATTFSLQVTVPALGVAGPYFSPTRDLYHSKTEPSLVVGSSPAFEDFSLGTNTVVLAHGILSDETSWGVVDAPTAGHEVMRNQFEVAGFHTEAVRRDWTRSIPDQGNELQLWFAHQPFKSAFVVAHSMGGLAARWYIERTPLDGGGNRIPLLVTLGTPNHGAPAATDVSDLLDLLGGVELAKQAIAWTLDMTKMQFETKLLQRWTFLTDLRPNSANLDALNYGDPQHGDLPSRFSCLDHEPEQVPTTTRYVTIDGDSQQWLSPLWAEVPCSSDGVVPVASAKIFKPSRAQQRIQNVRTRCLPDLYSTADCGSSHVSVLGCVDYKRSYCVSRNVIGVLGGADIAATCPTVGFEAVAVAADTALQRLAESDHLLAPGGSAVDSFQVASGDYLGVRVRWWRGGMHVALRSPSGAVVDSATCAGDPTRLFVSDYVGRFARLDVAGAEAGWWRLTSTLTSDSTQMISVRPYVSGSVVLDVAVGPARPAPGQSLVISGTLKAADVAILGANVSVEVRDPADNVGVVTLHDDGVAPDVVAADGTYAGSFSGTSTAGRYVVTVHASDGGTAPYAPRQARTSVQVGASPQISLASSDISYTSLWAYPSYPVSIGVSVHNLADVAADSVWVIGRDDSTGVAFLDTVVAVPARAAIALASRFSSTRIGLHPLSFMAQALGDVPDPATGNRATRVAEVVAFGGAPTTVSAEPAQPSLPPRAYLLTRAVPNPSTGATTLEFYLPRSTDAVRVLVTDAAGRLVARTTTGRLAPGWQRVVWSAFRDDGARVTPGVYFYRLEAAGLAGQGRVVIVR